MSDTYRKVTYYKCEHCGRDYEHPSLAENCWYRDQLGEILEDVDNHVKLARSDMLDAVQEMVDDGYLDYEEYTERNNDN